MTELEEQVAWAKLSGCSGSTPGQVLVEFFLREDLDPSRGFAYAGVIWPVQDDDQSTWVKQRPWIEIRHKTGQCRAHRTWPDAQDCTERIIQELSEEQLLELAELLEWSSGL